jgi:type IV pilus assembly protein PilW
MMLENQVHQDIRAAADIVARDLRRAGYWAHAPRSVWPDTAVHALANPYAGVAATNTQVVYARSQDEVSYPEGTDDNNVDLEEQVGFRFNAANKTVDMLVGPGWQALTDPNVLEVTQFDVNLTIRNVAAPCAADCPSGPNGRPLQLQTREAVIVIAAQAKHDASIRRSVQSTLKLRNDLMVEAP